MRATAPLQRDQANATRHQHAGLSVTLPRRHHGHPFFSAKCFPFWQSCPEIQKAHAKFTTYTTTNATDFHTRTRPPVHNVEDLRTLRYLRCTGVRSRQFGLAGERAEASARGLSSDPREVQARLEALVQSAQQSRLAAELATWKLWPTSPPAA